MTVAHAMSTDATLMIVGLVVVLVLAGVVASVVHLLRR
jgi:hypothetical protein